MSRTTGVAKVILALPSGISFDPQGWPPNVSSIFSPDHNTLTLTIPWVFGPRHVKSLLDSIEVALSVLGVKPYDSSLPSPSGATPDSPYTLMLDGQLTLSPEAIAEISARAEYSLRSLLADHIARS